MIILEMFVTALSDHPQAIFFSRRPTSLNRRSSREVVFGAITPVLNQIAMLVNNRSLSFILSHGFLSLRVRAFA